MVHEIPADRARGRGRHPRRLRREETAQRIALAALEIVGAEGVEALTMQRLGRELGYAPGAVYRYFRSKDEILAAAQEEVLRALHTGLRERLEAAEAHVARSPSVDPASGALVLLLTVGRYYEGLAETRPTHFRLLASSIGDPRELIETQVAERLLPGLLALFREVTVLFERAASDGALEPGEAERRAVLFWAGIQGVMQLRKLGRFEVPALDVGTLVSGMLHSLLTGWGADPGRLADADGRARRLVREVGP